MFHVILFQPEIPPNTGNVIRLCANTGARLHLVKPLGFTLEDAQLRRAGLDYHEYATLQVHESLDDALAAIARDNGAPARVFALSTRGSTRFDTPQYLPGDVFLFGPETRGLPGDVLDSVPAAQRLRLPMRPDNRSLNLSNTVAVVVFEAWRQQGLPAAPDQRRWNTVPPASTLPRSDQRRTLYKDVRAPASAPRADTMQVTPLHRGALSVLDFRCQAGPHTPTQVERHDFTSVSYVRRGSFGYRARGEEFELVAGSVLVGQCGDEFVCTHEHHHGGDECLSFKLAPELADSFDAAPRHWRAGGLPPLPELMVLGELAQAAVAGDSDFGVDEAGLLLVGRYLSLADGRRASGAAGHGARPPPRGGSGAVAGRARARGHRPGSHGRAGRAQRLAFPAPVRARGRRDAAPVPAARAAASGGAHAGAGRTPGHRCRPRCRLRRPVEFRPQLPSRGRLVAAAFPPRRARRPRADRGAGATARSQAPLIAPRAAIFSKYRGSRLRQAGLPRTEIRHVRPPRTASEEPRRQRALL